MVIISLVSLAFQFVSKRMTIFSYLRHKFQLVYVSNRWPCMYSNLIYFIYWIFTYLKHKTPELTLKTLISLRALFQGELLRTLTQGLQGILMSTKSNVKFMNCLCNAQNFITQGGHFVNVNINLVKVIPLPYLMDRGRLLTQYPQSSWPFKNHNHILVYWTHKTNLFRHSFVQLKNRGNIKEASRSITLNSLINLVSGWIFLTFS